MDILFRINLHPSQIQISMRVIFNLDANTSLLSIMNVFKIFAE